MPQKAIQELKIRSRKWFLSPPQAPVTARQKSEAQEKAPSLMQSGQGARAGCAAGTPTDRRMRRTRTSTLGPEAADSKAGITAQLLRNSTSKRLPVNTRSFFSETKTEENSVMWYLCEEQKTSLHHNFSTRQEEMG